MSTDSEPFPILQQWSERDRTMHAKWIKECPRSIPWAMVRPHEAQAISNHSQSLATLARRGGLGACEMVAVLEDRRHRPMTADDAVSLLCRYLRRWLDDEWARALD